MHQVANIAMNQLCQAVTPKWCCCKAKHVPAIKFLDNFSEHCAGSPMGFINNYMTKMIWQGGEMLFNSMDQTNSNGFYFKLTISDKTGINLKKLFDSVPPLVEEFFCVNENKAWLGTQ